MAKKKASKKPAAKSTKKSTKKSAKKTAKKTAKKGAALNLCQEAYVALQKLNQDYDAKLAALKKRVKDVAPKRRSKGKGKGKNKDAKAAIVPPPRTGLARFTPAPASDRREPPTKAEIAFLSSSGG